MKKIIILFAIIGILSGCSYQNELIFKGYNEKGIKYFQNQNYALAKESFQKSIEFLPKWELIADNNMQTTLYETKNYTEAEKKYYQLIETKCNIEKQQNISPYCENIFYGLGNTLYRLGEQKKEAEQKNKWQEAIKNYEKTLQINPDNVWAKENIAFIKKRLSEIENKEQQNDGQNKDGQNSKQENTNSNSKEKQDQSAADKEKQENGSDSNQTKNNDNSQNTSDEKNADKQASKEGGNEEENNEIAPSRLPEEIQKGLEEYQKQLEDSESQNQQFFQRNSNAQQNQNNDPLDNLFENDPFFQEFFQDDAMMQQFFGNNQKNFNNNLPNENEKDW